MTKFMKHIVIIVSAIGGVAAISMMNPRQLAAQIRGVLVQDMDHPARQPVYLDGSILIPAGNLTGSIQLQICTGSSSICPTLVPAGKRLVIDFLTVKATLRSPGAILSQMDIRTGFGIGNTEYYLDVPFQGIAVDGDRIYRATHTVRMYADPGKGVFAQAGRSPIGEVANVAVGGTGYLVDLN